MKENIIEKLQSLPEKVREESIIEETNVVSSTIEELLDYEAKHLSDRLE